MRAERWLHLIEGMDRGGTWAACAAGALVRVLRKPGFGGFGMSRSPAGLWDCHRAWVKRQCDHRFKHRLRSFGSLLRFVVSAVAANLMEVRVQRSVGVMRGAEANRVNALVFMEKAGAPGVHPLCTIRTPGGAQGAGLTVRSAGFVAVWLMDGA